MKSKKLLLFVVLLIVAAGIIGVIITQKSIQTGEKKAIKIGAILPLTGSLAFFGGPEKEVLLMRLDEINTNGGINQKPLKLIIEDSKSSAKDGVSALQKILLEKPSAVITSLTIISNSTQAILKTQKIPQIALSVHPTLAKQSEYTIRPYYGFEDEMKVIANYIVKKGYKKVGVLWVMVPESEIAIKEILTPEISNSGGEVIASESYNLGESNIKSQLTKIVEKGPDAIIAMDFGNLMGIILKEAEAMGVRNKIIGGIGLFYAPPIETHLLEGIPFAGPSFIINNSQKFREFEVKFKEKTGQNPSYDVMYTLDAFSLIIEAIRIGGDKPPDEILSAIRSMKQFNGITGNMQIHSDGNVTVDIDMGIYHNGKMDPLNK